MFVFAAASACKRELQVPPVCECVGLRECVRLSEKKNERMFSGKIVLCTRKRKEIFEIRK